MFNWYAALDNAKQRIAQLENSISVVREGLQRAERETDKSIAQRILAVREQELERTKVYVELIEHKLAMSPFRAPPRR
jgi:aminoglycoside/choline kinase family phosphotransferase